jgi:hypothetical protein
MLQRAREVWRTLDHAIEKRLDGGDIVRLTVQRALILNQSRTNGENYLRRIGELDDSVDGQE